MCNKKTGKWETVSTEYVYRNYNYGKCGDGNNGNGGGTGINLVDLFDWFPRFPSLPDIPIDPPVKKTYKDEDDNKQPTKIFDGCYTDCEEAAAKLPASCGSAALGCIPDPTLTTQV